MVLRYCKVHEGGKRLECGKQLQAPHSGGGGKWGEKTSSQRDLYSEAVDFSHIGGFLPMAFPSSLPPES